MAGMAAVVVVTVVVVTLALVVAAGSGGGEGAAQILFDGLPDGPIGSRGTLDPKPREEADGAASHPAAHHRVDALAFYE